MPRPVTLFTGQWADLPLAELAPLAQEMGYDGLELACWGDHFDVDRGARAARLRRRASWALLADARPAAATRSRPTSSARRCATASTSATRRSCRRTSGATAIPRACASARCATRGRPRPPSAAAAAFGVERRQRLHRLEHLALASTPSRRPSQDYWERASHDFAKRWTPILDAFDEARRATSRSRCTRPRSRSTSPPPQRALEAVGGHPRFGFNFDPSHLGYQGVDYVEVHPHASATASSTST